MTFLNRCEIPQKVLFDLALKRRIDTSHPKRPEIDEDYRKRIAGYHGEKSLEYYLEKLPLDRYHFIHGLRLPSKNKGKFFQTDNVVLVDSHLINLEVKNWSGIIHFDKNLDQVFQISSDKSKRERMQNPIIQAKMQAYELKNWLARQGLGHVPIEHYFVNSNPKTTITTDLGNEQVLQRVCNSESLIDKILKTNEIHPKAQLDQIALKELGASLLAANTPLQYDIQKEYQISPNEIITGVHCPQCFSIPMVYKHGRWDCNTCGHQSKTAFVDTINDYFLLINPFITNNEVRRFLHIPSIYVANGILNAMNLPYSGFNKGRIYLKPEKMYKNIPLVEK